MKSGIVQLCLQFKETKSSDVYFKVFDSVLHVPLFWRNSSSLKIETCLTKKRIELFAYHDHDTETNTYTPLCETSASVSEFLLFLPGTLSHSPAVLGFPVLKREGGTAPHVVSWLTKGRPL